VFPHGVIGDPTERNESIRCLDNDRLTAVGAAIV
jgi:hypothetical protein